MYLPDSLTHRLTLILSDWSFGGLVVIPIHTSIGVLVTRAAVLGRAAVVCRFCRCLWHVRSNVTFVSIDPRALPESLASISLDVAFGSWALFIAVSFDPCWCGVCDGP